MKRDIANIERDLENKQQNGDIIRAKHILETTFNEDPDLKEVLNIPELKPILQFADPEHPTEKELRDRAETEIYNQNLIRKQICPWLKLNNLQKDVSNYILYDVLDYSIARYDREIKYQQVEVMCVVHEQNMETEYGVARHDLLGFIIKDLLNLSNCLGTQLVCIYDQPEIIDDVFYCRVLKFQHETPIEGYAGFNNKHDRFGWG